MVHARENACDQVVIDFGFTPYWVIGSVERVFSNQSQSIVKET